MAKVSLQKIRVTGLRKHYKLLMQELHRKELLEIIHNEALSEASLRQIDDHFGVFDLARIDFAIRLLAPFAPTKAKFEELLSGGKIVLGEEIAKERLKAFSPQAEEIVHACEKLEEVLVRTENEREKIARHRRSMQPYASLKVPFGEALKTETSISWIGALPLAKETPFLEAMALQSHLIDVKIFSREGSSLYLRITAHKEVSQEVQQVLSDFHFMDADFAPEIERFAGKFIREALQELAQYEQKLLKEHEQARQELKKLAQHTDDLKILYDYNAWRKRKNDLQGDIFQSSNLFAFEAWMPEKAFDDLQEWVEKIFVGEVSVDKAEQEEGEVVPTLLSNKCPVASFEPITEMFGMPSHKDVDPTPWLAPFFFIFFGLCLSDVGYGLILASVGLFFFLFGNFGKAAKDGILLLFLCGVGATLGGIVLGGYFGMTPEQAPSLLLTEAYRAGDMAALPFKGQFLNPMEGQGPILFLMISMALGFAQLLIGIFADFVRQLRNKQYFDAVCDPLAWLFFLIVLGGFALAGPLGLDKNLWSKLALIGAGILVITQGRDQKNWLMKPIFGLLGLYNITGYVSDLLSYSRVMALGLATGVIGFAMNLTAGILGGMLPSFIGIIVAVVVILAGHALNFSLSLLGAFVHSGRLQFIEFFGKFYEGSGRKFKPFARSKRYLFFR